MQTSGTGRGAVERKELLLLLWRTKRGWGGGSGRSGSEDGSPGFQAALPTLPLLPLFILRCFLHCSLLLEVRDELWWINNLNFWCLKKGLKSKKTSLQWKLHTGNPHLARVCGNWAWVHAERPHGGLLRCCSWVELFQTEGTVRCCAHHRCRMRRQSQLPLTPPSPSPHPELGSRSSPNTQELLPGQTVG